MNNVNMTGKELSMSNYIVHDHNHDGVDRRGFLKCMAWAGTGLLWAASGGIFRSRAFADVATKSDLAFAQISDSHIGFSKEANKDVIGTLQAAIARINALPTRPEFLIHT